MIGTRLAQYEITNHLGSGGMGDVYQATDSKLGRNVAIKFLPEAFARDPERASRFEREARILASLNHPNIESIHGMEESQGQKFLVMELVSGETLSERIKRGPIPASETLDIAKQIAEALEAAHDSEKGIIHRDLKPANVKITSEGKVKVLDFGLAKAYEPEPATPGLSNSPTLSLPATLAGVILGTAAYMSPEQAKGRPVDRRTDIFAFGCVLFEMLTGRSAFEGETVAEILAAVLKAEPDWNRLPGDLNPRLRALLRRCLEKNPRQRWYAAGDVRIELESIEAGGTDTAVPQRRSDGLSFWKVAAVFAFAVVIAVGITAAVFSRRPSAPLTLTRFPVVIPDGQIFTGLATHVVAISPDGQNIVYVANQQLYLRTLGDIEARPIPGTDQDPSTPFFSPDGRWIGFWAGKDGKLKKVATSGGTALAICDADNASGATWTADNVIYLGQGSKGIAGVSADGGKLETIVAVKPGDLAYSPQAIPEAGGILFGLARGVSAANANRWDLGEVVFQSLQSGERKTILTGGSDGRYASSGHLLYAVGNTIMAVPFDVSRLEVQGGAIPVIEGLRRSNNSTTAAANFSISANGSMVYVPSGSGDSNKRGLFLVDKDGVRKALNIEPAAYSNPRFSPDGKQLTVESTDGPERIVWVYDLSAPTPRRRLTFGGSNQKPLWSLDGRRIQFTSNRDTGAGIFWQLADGSGPAEQLASTEVDVVPQSESWTPDGKTLIFSRRVGVASTGLFTLTMGGDQKLKPLLPAPAGNASLSRDGRWLAYTSTETGRSEIYVQPFPPSGPKYQLTATGGTSPLWSPDGKQLFYADARQVVVAIDVQTEPNFVPGTSTPLPTQAIATPGPRPYDVSPDGKYFLVMYPTSQTNPNKPVIEQINVTVNWFEELRQRMPAP